MAKDELSRQYDKLIFRIALLKSLRLSILLLDVVLIVAAITCTALGYTVNSPVLVMLFGTVMPYIFETIQNRRNVSKSVKNNLLPTLVERYKYNDIECNVRFAVYVFTCLLLYYWHHISFYVYPGYWGYMPLGCLISAVIFLCMGAVIFTVKIRRKLSHGLKINK